MCMACVVPAAAGSTGVCSVGAWPQPPPLPVLRSCDSLGLPAPLCRSLSRNNASPPSHRTLPRCCPPTLARSNAANGLPRIDVDLHGQTVADALATVENGIRNLPEVRAASRSTARPAAGPPCSATGPVMAAGSSALPILAVQPGVPRRACAGKPRPLVAPRSPSPAAWSCVTSPARADTAPAAWRASSLRWVPCRDGKPARAC